MSKIDLDLPEIQDARIPKKSWRRILWGIILLLLLGIIAQWCYQFYINSSAATSWLHANMWMVIVFVLFALGDDITTEIALRQTNGQGELNPLANALFQKKHGKLLMRLYKWPLIAVIVVAMAAAQDNKAMLFITSAYGLVVLNNLRAITEYILCPDITRAVRAIKTNTIMYVIRIVFLFAIAAFVAYGADKIS
jgi:hypothetical protein